MSRLDPQKDQSGVEAVFRAVGLTKVYQMGEVPVHALRGIDLHLYEGELVTEGLALITRAVEDGYFIPLREAYLQSLYEHPDFAAIRAMQEARQAREREKFLAVV